MTKFEVRIDYLDADDVRTLPGSNNAGSSLREMAVESAKKFRLTILMMNIINQL
ncbi:hypothetical protein [Rhizobium ruizarguesonis]|uniref:hypothetical protein n=1 Tax=Rhizobium ruizarguesonis TaxID=2081791 RepID=UPI0013EEA733|nr:hypothetical protein [Rhizobium ruizarguesonis]